MSRGTSDLPLQPSDCTHILDRLLGHSSAVFAPWRSLHISTFASALLEHLLLRTVHIDVLSVLLRCRLNFLGDRLHHFLLQLLSLLFDSLHREAHLFLSGDLLGHFLRRGRLLAHHLHRCSDLVWRDSARDSSVSVDPTRQEVVVLDHQLFRLESNLRTV